MKTKKIKFIVNAVRFHDYYGNTYHSVYCSRVSDGSVIAKGETYGYGDHYQQTALEIMHKAGWIRNKKGSNLHMYDREHNYPITWHVTDGRRKDMIANAKI